MAAGASIGALIIDYLIGPAGEWGQIAHVESAYRGPAFTGDATFMIGDTVDKRIDGEAAIAQADVQMATRLGVAVATARAGIELPKR